MFSVRGGEGGIKSFEGSLKTKRNCRGMLYNCKGLRNYGGAECCFQVAFSGF